MKGVGWYRGRGLRAQSPVQMFCVLSGTVFLSSKSYLDWKVFGFQLPCSWISRTSSWAPTHASQGRVAGAELQATEESRRKSFWTRLSLLPLPSKGGFFSGQAAWSVGEGPPASGLGSELRIMWQRLLTFFADVGNLKEPWSFFPKEIELADSHVSLQGMATIFTQYRF